MSAFVLLGLVMFGTDSLHAQWTAPDSTVIVQPGPGAQTPWISNDNLRLYFSSTRDLALMSRVHPDSAWGPLTLLPPHINLTPTQRCPAESPSGDTLYWIGDPRPDTENYGSWDIFFAVRNGPCDTCWGAVQNAGPEVSSPSREYSVGISRDGATLLVASTRGQFVAPKLYWHDKQPDGAWGPAHYFPAEINDLNSGVGHPCLSPDNQRLFFCHTHSMLGDIWVSQKVNGVWQPAGPLPSPPNDWLGATADEDPCLAMDGRTLWYRHAFERYYNYTISVSVDTAVQAVALPRLFPTGYALHPSHPNPFNPATEIRFDMPLAGRVELTICNSLGHRVATLVDEPRPVGTHAVVWDAGHLPSGLYFCRMAAGGFCAVTKLVLVK